MEKSIFGLKMERKIERKIREQKKRIKKWIKDIREDLRNIEEALKKEEFQDASDIMVDVILEVVWLEEDLEVLKTLRDLLNENG